MARPIERTAAAAVLLLVSASGGPAAAQDPDRPGWVGEIVAAVARPAVRVGHVPPMTPSDARAYEVTLEKADADFARGDFRMAALRYQAARNLCENSLVLRSLARSKLGLATRRPGDEQELCASAIDDLDLAIALAPPVARDAAQDLALMYLTRGDCQVLLALLETIPQMVLFRRIAALRDFTRSVALNPDDWVPYANRGKVRQVLGDHNGAVQDVAHALRLAPPAMEAALRHTQAIALELAGRVPEAIDSLTRAEQAMDAAPEQHRRLLRDIRERLERLRKQQGAKRSG